MNLRRIFYVYSTVHTPYVLQLLRRYTILKTHFMPFIIKIRVLDRHRFIGNLDPDQTYNFWADQDPDPDLDPTQVLHMLENRHFSYFYKFFSQRSVCIALSFASASQVLYFQQF
jgi:hypothetical protein